MRKLFALEVPEIADGSVEIVAVAREAGHRSKIAVRTTVPGLNAKGACIGPMGQRVRNVMSELHGEKIDIVDWSDDPATFVASALSPARVTQRPGRRPRRQAVRVVVPDYQLSLAIGKEGQNARLAARLTGCRIDIRSDAQPARPRTPPSPGVGRAPLRSAPPPGRGDRRAPARGARPAGARPAARRAEHPRTGGALDSPGGRNADPGPHLCGVPDDALRSPNCCASSCGRDSWSRIPRRRLPGRGASRAPHPGVPARSGATPGLPAGAAPPRRQRPAGGRSAPGARPRRLPEAPATGPDRAAADARPAVHRRTGTRPVRMSRAGRRRMTQP